ncbi:MAG: glycosyltransferase family 4 protein [Betaproteobacteria bacterium]
MLYELPFANLGGTEKHLLTLVSALRREVAPCLLAPNGDALRLFHDLGVPYRTVPPLSLGLGVRHALRAHAAAFRELMSKFRPRLVHVHCGIECAIAARLAAPDIPIVFTIHGYPDAASYVISGFLANRIVDEVICVSEAERRVAQRYGFRKDRLTVIRNGVAPPAPSVPSLRRELRERLGFREDAVVIGTVSRLERRKGTAHLISSLARIRRECPGAVLLVVGDGRMRRDLERLAIGLGVRDKVVFTGALADPGDALESMDIFALPSFQEALGMAILEAMARAKPVVATAVGGIPEAVVHGETGLLVPPRDDYALASAILALARDPEKRQEMGARGRARFEALFSAGAMARQTLEVYGRVLAHASARAQASDPFPAGTTPRSGS